MSAAIRSALGSSPAASPTHASRVASRVTSAARTSSASGSEVPQFKRAARCMIRRCASRGTGRRTPRPPGPAAFRRSAAIARICKSASCLVADPHARITIVPIAPMNRKSSRPRRPGASTAMNRTGDDDPQPEQDRHAGDQVHQWLSRQGLEPRHRSSLARIESPARDRMTRLRRRGRGDFAVARSLRCQRARSILVATAVSGGGRAYPESR